MTPVELPSATQRPRRQSRWPWLIPLAAVAFAGWLAYDAYSRSGVPVSISLPAGYGLRIGDEVRFRGIAVGTVEAIDLGNELDAVIVRARLHSQGERLARAGSRFWVVRPEVGFGGVVGLETIVGPRYLAVSPGEGGPQRQFVGLADPPMVEAIDPGDLEIIIEAPRQAGVRPGGPVSYRQVRIGTVLSVGLTSDGAAVEARVHIQKAYAQLIHPESKFWNGGGLEARVGFRGVTVDVESIEALIGGGIGVATPAVASAPVRTGHRFPLYDKPEKEWLEWTPLVVIGSPFLPPGAVMPSPLRATLRWEHGTLLTREKSRQGWVLQTTRGLLGPSDLLDPPGKAHEGTAALEVGGQRLSLTEGLSWSNGVVAVRAARVTDKPWRGSKWRAAREPEDIIIVGDAAGAPVPLAAARLNLGDKPEWTIDSAVSLDENWHGAAAVARGDGALVGMLICHDGAPRIALLPAELPVSD